MTIFWQRLTLLILMMTTYVVVFTPAHAESSQSLDSIASAVVLAAEENAKKLGYSSVNVEVRPLDSRLRLPQCANPLSTFTSPGSSALGAISVGVRCSENKPWTIYVRANVSAQKSVPILTRSLSRHTLITEQDIELASRPIQSSTQDIIYDPSQIIGMEAARPLSVGSTVRTNQLRPPKVISRGQQITLIAGDNGLEVRMQGKALKDAAVGERVNVTNLSSGQQVEGIANSDGTVSVQ